MKKHIKLTAIILSLIILVSQFFSVTAFADESREQVALGTQATISQSDIQDYAAYLGGNNSEKEVKNNIENTRRGNRKERSS